MREMSFNFPPPPSNWLLSEDRWYADLHAAISMQLFHVVHRVANDGASEAGYRMPVESGDGPNFTGPGITDGLIDEC